jgi:hypothetical protein
MEGLQSRHFANPTFCYGSYTTITNVLPSDLFFPESVTSVSGFSASGCHRHDHCLCTGSLHWPDTFLRFARPWERTCSRSFDGSGGVNSIRRNDSSASAGAQYQSHQGRISTQNLKCSHSSPVTRSECSGKSTRQIRYKAMSFCPQFVNGRSRRNVQRLVVCVTPGEVRRLLRQDDRA